MQPANYDSSRYLPEQRSRALQGGQQFHPLTNGVAGQKALIQQAYLGAYHQHHHRFLDLCPGLV